MTADLHERAKHLVTVSSVAEISGDEQEWLDIHLVDCHDCSKYAAEVRRSVVLLRSISIPLRPSLVAATRRRVQLRALELRRQEAGLRTLWVSCALSWLLGAASAPLLWWAFQWVGQRLDLPRVIWITAFGLWWLTPAVAVGAALAWQGTSTWQENGEAGSIFRLQSGTPPFERNAGEDEMKTGG